MITLLALAAAAVLAAPVAASAAGGASYSGTTSQHERVAMTVARSKRSLSRFDAVVRAACSDGQRDWTHFVLPRGDRSLAVKRGRIAKRISLGPAGSPAVGHLSVKARFGRTGVVSGSLSATWRYSDGTTCSSASIAFRVRRGRYAPPRDPREPHPQHPAGQPTPGQPTPGAPSTPPPSPPLAPGTAPVITAAGDLCGDTSNCTATANLVLSTNPNTALTLGDNAYEDGSLSQYTSFYDPQWGRFKSKTKPTSGNHEYHTGGAQGYFSYFGSAIVPGPYYSYDIGDWHMIALASSAGVSPASGGAEEAWLKADLASNTKPCTLAYWHEPRFSSGTVHGSDSDWAAVWQDLYNANADVVLNGHEHTYERFAPQTPGAVADSARGIVEVVSGTGGEGGSYPFGTPLTNSVARSGSGTFGVVKMTLYSNGYDLDFVPIAGQSFQDHYSGTCH